MLIKQSPALKLLKKEIGQANHMLITIMVGLDGIVPYHLEANSEFHASWNPKSQIVSVERSKEFAKKSALAWLVDCLDMYLRVINQSPSLITDGSLKQQIDSPDNSRSVYKRIDLICNHFKIESTNYALADLLICWRNRLTHFHAENDISSHNRDLLVNKAGEISDDFCGLDINRTLDSFNKPNKPGFPTFKEVTSFVRASINLAYEIDDHLIGSICLEQYADQVLFEYFKDGERRFNNIFSKDQKSAEKSLKQILCHNAFCDEDKNGVDDLCVQVSKLNCGDAKSRWKSGTFI